ncbi:MAG: hypothetical protein M9899_07140 [Bdellovibrionaceae bacterium]|nr:hypothetical protein [Pseudobdellovibrionaceae bacterium]
MKWVKILLISSLAVLQFSACSLDSNDEGMSVSRMKDGNRGLPVPAGDIPNLDVQNLQATDWGRIHSNELPEAFRQKLMLMMQTTPGVTPLLGNVSPAVTSPDGTGVAFKGRLHSADNLSLSSGANAYFESLKTKPNKIQLYIGIFDSYVGQWSNGTVIEPYSFYFGALNSGYNGNIAFEYQIETGQASYQLYLIDQYGAIAFSGTLVSGAPMYTEGVVFYQSKLQGSTATWTQIGNFKIGACNLFKCS